MTDQPVEIALVVVACLFALFAGANDGGSLLATSLKTTSLRPLTATVVLAATVGLVPLVFGTQVATTLADRLVTFDGSRNLAVLLVAVAGATLVVAALSRRGLPTSLTLALIGSIIGAGLGAGFAVAWPWVLGVLALAVAAPIVGLLGARIVTRLLAVPRARTALSRRLRRLHRIGFALLAFAYSANDGQKILAVLVLASSAGDVDPQGVPAAPLTLLSASALFLVGALFGIRRYATRLGSAVLPVSPVHGVTAQLSAVAAVTGSAAAGMPVSMTQVIAGALVGSGLAESSRRVRWNQAVSIVGAWVLTVPAATAVCALAAAIVTHV